MKYLPLAAALAALVTACASGEAPSPDREAAGESSGHWDEPGAPDGDFTIVAVRRASDVAGGPIEEAAAKRIGETVSFDAPLTWWDGKSCNPWSASGMTERVLPLDDPNLSDTQVPPVDGPASAGDRRLNAGWELECEGEPLGVMVQVDRRVAIVPTKSGVTNLILEKPLSPGEIRAFQEQLKDMKFYSGKPSSEWDEDSLAAVASYAEYRGAKSRFARPAITENLLDGLGIIAENQGGRPEDGPARLTRAADRSPSIKDRFPDYEPKETPDTLLDYRPSLSGQVAALPAARPENLKALIGALREWNEKAQESPGEWTEGNVALGADPKEYVPSDAELMVAEICGRIERIVFETQPSRLKEALDEQDIKLRSIVYKRFTFRHVDVMGSGRFFYASPPQKAVIEIRAHEKQE